MANQNPSIVEQLKRAVEIAEQMETLQGELDSLLQGAGAAPKHLNFLVTRDFNDPSKARKKRILSPEAREKIAAAQRLRWGKYKKAETLVSHG